MRTLDEVLNQLGYHPATAKTGPVHDSIRAEFINHSENIWDLVPDGPEKTLAFRALQQSLMYCNLAIALSGD